MTIAYFDCFSGAAGDMIVGALLDTGADFHKLQKQLDALHIAGYSVAIEEVKRGGIRATHFRVIQEDNGAQPHRHLRDIQRIVEAASLTAQAKEKVLAIFKRLAQAEAAVHGISIDKVHFHEVGAVDAIVDVTSAVLVLEMLGVERIVCSPITTGSGVVTCEHGVLPVPAPATAELLRDVPVAGGPESTELITPTGAAILTTLADEFAPVPPMILRKQGFGAGTREGAAQPNLLRVLIGEPEYPGDVDEITVLETCVDDCTPEIVGHCIEQLREKGALDVYAVPIQMKKSRAAVLLTVLCRHDDVETMNGILFTETSTFGVRRHRVQRDVLRRRQETVATPYGEITVKVGERDGSETVSPEYESCRAAALQSGAPLREVMDAAREAWLTQRR